MLFPVPDSGLLLSPDSQAAEPARPVPRRPRFFSPGESTNDTENDMEMVLLIVMAAGALSYIQRERERMLQRARVKTDAEPQRIRVIRH